MPVAGQRFRLMAEEDQSPDEGGGGGGSHWGWYVAGAVLATGAALALVIGAAGDAAEKNNPSVNNGNPPDPNCEVDAGTLGIPGVNGCAVGI
jgi:hypothetical protein